MQALFGAAVWRRPDFSRVSALRQARLQQMAARHEQIGERAGDEQAVRVLVEPAVAGLGEAEDALDDEERVLNLGPIDLVRFFARSFSSMTPLCLSIGSQFFHAGSH